MLQKAKGEIVQKRREEGAVVFQNLFINISTLVLHIHSCYLLCVHVMCIQTECYHHDGLR